MPLKRFLILLVALFVLWPTRLHAADRITLRAAMVTPEGSRWTEESQKLSREIEKLSQGRLHYVLYHSGVKGDEFETVDRLRSGELDLVIVSDVALAAAVPEMNLMNLPFMFRNNLESTLVMDRLMDRFRALFKAKGFHLLVWMPLGPGYIYTDRPVRSIKDFKGIKMWVWQGDPVGRAMMEELPEVTPVPLGLMDVKSALEQGKVNAVYNVPLATVALQWYPHLKYAIEVPMVMAGGGTIYSLKVWEGLSDHDRKVITTAAEKLQASMRESVASDSVAATRGLKKSGITFLTPDADSLREFQETTDRVKAKLVGTLIPKALSDEADAILKSYRKSSTP